MDPTRVIIGAITTEKSERGKEARTWTLRVTKEATKVDVKKALKKLYDVDVESARVMRVGPKTRQLGNARTMTKRKTFKKVLVTLSTKSKPLDLVQFKA